ncbi:type VI secretion system tip protein TssI/VgrG [Vibrio sp. SCSIO 43136]|uniref:type VI secretion system Vgr family protein n=1 Tax=Vibrio sp. SCSIO 43136 TaxID=2819101 RepID=UPI002074B69A|nr:type VI secretion system tip protein TssI/VgrG [Vibrio sp. SCSIO 43136]USD66337.1 type VI secretion system tip protein VgrG [Vibrio sp. SCSIO 43136]
MYELIDPKGAYLVVTDDSNNEFIATELTVTEQLNGEYEWQAEIVVSRSTPQDWIGGEVTCTVYDLLGGNRDSLRQFKGVVVKAQSHSPRIDSSYFGIRISVKPWFSLLEFSQSNRVFQEQNVQTIVTSVFDDLGFKGKYSVKSMPSTKREYCVQFNESDLDFVTRLLAEEGVHFYFGKDDKSDTLYLQDASKSFGQDNLVTLDYIASASGDYEVITKWQRAHQFHSASAELTAYDYNQSKLVTSKAKKSKYSLSGNTKLTQSFYPVASKDGSFSDLASNQAEIWRAQQDSQYHLVQAVSESTQLATGFMLKLADHPVSDEKGSYVVSAVEYQFKDAQAQGLKSDVSFQCVPEDQVLYPPHQDKPVVHGLQSAVVAGATKGEPASDASGRVRIKFHWDPETGDKTSCWVRVAQALAGNGYGHQFLPRAGQEVLVSFINGDPDQPVIVSSVYNSTNKPTYPTANSTQSGIKTKLSGAANEIRFDDKKDNEQLYFAAAKDWVSEVANDRTETVKGLMSLAVTKTLTYAIDESFTMTAKKGFSMASEQSFSFEMDDAISGKGKTITLEASDTLTLKVGSSKLVISSSKIEIDSDSVAVSGSSSIKLDGGSLSQSGSSVSIKSDGSLSAKGGTSVSLSAGTGLTAKAGTTATLQGLNANVKADVSASVKGSATAELSASGQATVKGAIVMVN